MKAVSAVALISLISSTWAAPLEARHNVANPFTLDVTYSDSPLSGPIQAADGSFWIGKKPATYCPDNVKALKACPPGNTTSFISSGDGTLSLNTEVPGGQQVYIASNGLLTYTVPHSGYIPPDAQKTGFEILPNNLFGKFFEFWLCAEDKTDKAYRIWLKYRDFQGNIQQHGLDGKGACTLVNLMAKDTKTKDEAAWEYD